MNLKVKNDLIYVADDGSRSFKVFDKEYSHIRNIPFLNKVRPDTEFDIDTDQNVYHYTRRNEIASKMSFDGKNLGSIGDYKEHFFLDTRDRSNSQTNSWHIAYSNDTILAVNECEPIILMFLASKKKLINSYDLSKIDQLKDRLKYVDNEFKQDPYNPSAYILISDVVLRGKNLFILTTGHNKVTNRPDSYKILELELLDDNKLTVVNNFNLDKTGWYNCFTIFEEKVLTYNRITESLEVYTIPE